MNRVKYSSELKRSLVIRGDDGQICTLLYYGARRSFVCSSGHRRHRAEKQCAEKPSPDRERCWRITPTHSTTIALPLMRGVSSWSTERRQFINYSSERRECR